MSTSDPIKQAWQGSVTQAEIPDITKLRADADRFYRQVDGYVADFRKSSTYSKCACNMQVPPVVA